MSIDFPNIPEIDWQWPDVDPQRLADVLQYDAVNPLLFNTGLFMLLFAAFIGVYALLSRFKYLKMVFVILFSLYFYYKSSAECCFILLGVCVSDYLLGVWLGAARRGWVRKTCVLINVLLNLGMLAYFKYFNLLAQTVAEFADKEFDALDIILPAGISFFTFRSISYIVDIYRRQIEPCRDFLAYTFYLTFFPPLLAGPVVRAKDMLPQVHANPRATRAMMAEGLFLIICGLVKKVVVADYLSQNFVDRVFDSPALFSGFENMLAIYGFSIQLYCDFSGYSDMAIGIALLLGYNFLDNFRSPFKSQNPSEFWRRWHISLSSWLRDYLYIPLGGNRCSRFRKNANLMTTMVLGGLWHGASWMY
ncbi:MAG: MBOAT family protein, partial [Paramuribaculum sp.]|nr:MBOAT family protein [Paramuribaculum sp.]